LVWGPVMIGKIRRLKDDESGAITADYVVLAGAIIALGLSAVNAIRLGTFEGSKNISDAVKRDCNTFVTIPHASKPRI